MRDETEDEGDEGSDARRDPLLVASIVRGFHVLDRLADAPSPPTVSELAQMSGVTFQSAQRIANVMIDSGYLCRDERLKTLRFSLRTLDLQYTYLRTDRLLKAAWVVLMALREQTRMRVSLCVLDGTDIVYLLRLASDPRDYQTLLIGRRRPAALTAGGLAILSALPTQERRLIVEASDLTPLTSRSLTRPETILARLEHCAAEGFCIEEQEVRSNEVSVAVPLLPAGGRATHAIVAAGPSDGRAAAAIRQEVVPLLQNAARALQES